MAVKIKYKLRKGDPVVVIAGKYKLTAKRNSQFKGAKITLIDRETGEVVVENVNIKKRHTKPNQLHPEGGIIAKAMPISISNVMYLCPKCDKGVRLGVRILEDGKKARFCKSCGEVIDKD